MDESDLLLILICLRAVVEEEEEEEDEDELEFFVLFVLVLLEPRSLSSPSLPVSLRSESVNVKRRLGDLVIVPERRL